MQTCLHTFVQTCIHTWVQICLHTWAYQIRKPEIHVHRYMYIWDTCIHNSCDTYMQKQKQTKLDNLRFRTYKPAHIHTYMHTCTHAYIHTYIHTHILTSTSHLPYENGRGRSQESVYKHIHKFISYSYIHTYIHIIITFSISCLHSCIHTYKYIHIHTYIHTAWLRLLTCHTRMGGGGPKGVGFRTRKYFFGTRWGEPFAVVALQRHRRCVAIGVWRFVSKSEMCVCMFFSHAYPHVHTHIQTHTHAGDPWYGEPQSDGYDMHWWSESGW